MKRRIHFSVLLLALIAALLASAVRPSTVYADEGDVPEATAEPTEPIEETSDEGDEQPVVEEEPPAVEEQVTVAEVLEQLPEDTELVVVNEAGEVEPLASVDAAEIIAAGDPMWCPVGATPGDANCTDPGVGNVNYDPTSFNSLLTYLAANPTYTGDGVIWVADDYAGNDDSQIEFDGDELTSLNNHNLTVQGGWSGGNNTTITGTSLVDVSMVFVNWTGNITLRDLDIDGAADDAGFGLLVSNTGDVLLNNVSVTDTALNSYGTGDGAIVDTSGDVRVTASNFDNNAGNGLQVEAGGSIYLEDVSASGNTLTGAYLDSCLYGAVDPGLCAGTDSVTVTGATTNIFNGNGFSGLVVDSAAGIIIYNTQANNNGLDGAYLTSADDDGTMSVNVTESEFSDNENGVGLGVLTDGSMDIAHVDASNNGTGMVLETTTTGYIDVEDVIVTDNTWTGLHAASSGGDIDLLDVVADNNGANGAYLDAGGNITVADSTFNDNVHFDFPQDPGLYAHSNGGDITLAGVIADGNDHGAGAVLTTWSNGVISVSDTIVNGNGTYGLQAENSNGGITLTGIEASYNGVKGVYLSSGGTGNISVVDSVFVENGSYGIYAVNHQADITLDRVTVTGDDGVDNGYDLTDVGALLKALNGGNVFVNSSIFELNTAAGLKIIGSNQVNLYDVAANGNGGNGVAVYSTYTASCICPDSEVVSVAVNVDGGMFTNNAGYGLMVKPGPDGSLLYIAPSIFGGNGAGDDLLDLSDPPECEKCGCDPEPVDTKNPNIVEVPFTGGEPVEQNCDLYSSTILQLPDGTWINVGCPFDGFSNLEGILEDGLPGPLGAGTEFLAGLNVGLTDADGNVILNEDGTVTITFKIPKDSRARSYSVLFWDPTLNDGNGGWVRMPIFEAGTSFPLHPENPDDGRVVLSGVQHKGNTVTLTVNFSGTFVLVTP